VQVLSVDFGGKEWVEVSSLQQLPDSLTDLPPFAVCCRLGNVEPVTPGHGDAANWSQSATDYLMNTTNGKLFTAWLEDSLPVGGIVRYSFWSDVLILVLLELYWYQSALWLKMVTKGGLDK